MENLSKKIRNIVINYVFSVFCAWFFLYLILMSMGDVFSFAMLFISAINLFLLIAIGNIARELYKALRDDKAKDDVADTETVS